MLRQIIVLLASTFVASASLAADNGIYLGVGIAQSNIDAEALALDGEDTKYKVIAGIRPLDWLAFEANYVDFGAIETPSGTPSGLQAEYKLQGVDVFAVGLFEVALVDIYAKAGVVSWNAELESLSSAFADADDDGVDFAYGAGLQLHLGSLSVRAEYEKFEVENADVDLISASVTWTFL